MSYETDSGTEGLAHLPTTDGSVGVITLGPYAAACFEDAGGIRFRNKYLARR